MPNRIPAKKINFIFPLSKELEGQPDVSTIQNGRLNFAALRMGQMLAAAIVELSKNNPILKSFIIEVRSGGGDYTQAELSKHEDCQWIIQSKENFSNLVVCFKNVLAELEKRQWINNDDTKRKNVQKRINAKLEKAFPQHELKKAFPHSGHQLYRHEYATLLEVFELDIVKQDLDALADSLIFSNGKTPLTSVIVEIDEDYFLPSVPQHEPGTSAQIDKQSNREPFSGGFLSFWKTKKDSRIEKEESYVQSAADEELDLLDFYMP